MKDDSEKLVKLTEEEKQIIKNEKRQQLEDYAVAQSDYLQTLKEMDN